MPRQKLTQVKINAARTRIAESWFEAFVCAAAARRLVAEPDLDPAFPAAAIWMQDLAAFSARNAARDVTRLIRHG